jgi:hypothetical protein
MKLKRLNDMSELERSIVLMVFEDVKDLPVYDCYRKYERGFTYEDKKYRYKCKYRIEDGCLKLIDTKIEHEQVTINLH